MIQSELLKEKCRIQKKLSGESVSVHEYLKRSHLAAKAVASSYGFSLQYVQISDKKGHSIASSLRSSATGNG